MLPGIISQVGYFGGESPLTSTYLGTDQDVVNRTTYTFTGFSLPGVIGQYVLIGVLTGSAGGAPSVSSATIDGETASVIYTNTASFTTAAWIIAPSTANATGTVSITMSGSCVRMGIVGYSLEGLQSTTATDTGGDTGDDPATTLDIEVGGAAFGVVYASGGAYTYSWTGLTEDTEQTIETSRSFGSAHEDIPDGDTGRTIQATDSGFDVQTVLAAIAMR